MWIGISVLLKRGWVILLFSGYVYTEGKIPKKNESPKKPHGAPPKRGDYAGVLKEGYIQIDIDDLSQAEKLYEIVMAQAVKCNVVRTTRGMHFYFRTKDKFSKMQGANTPLQIKADINTGDNKALVYIKIDGKFREWLQEYEQPDELPVWLRPFKSRKVVDFTGLKEGDGRNEALFEYILTLRRFGFTVDDCKLILNLINTHMFAVPLTEKEMEVITREDAFPRDSFLDENGKFQHNQFGDFLIQNEKIISIGKNLFIYKEGVYELADDEIERRMIEAIVNIKMQLRREVLSYIRLRAKVVDETASSRLIALKDGIYDLETGGVEPFSSDLVITNKINFIPCDSHQLMNKTLDKIACNDKEVRSLIEEMIGLCLYRRTSYTRAFVLLGEGSNGKSTLLKCITKLLGSSNCSFLSLQDTAERFRLAEIYGKLANIGDDIPEKYIEDNSIFKKLVTGEVITAERKGKDPFAFKNYATLIFSCNKVPKMKDKSNAVKRRLLIIPFDAEFKETDPDFDPYIEDKLLEDDAIGYLLFLGLEGLKRVIRANSFSDSKKVEMLLSEYEKENNPVMYFGEEFKIENEPTREVYHTYAVWCRENGYIPLANNEFGKVLKKKFGFVTKRKRITGNHISVYVKG